MENHQRKTSLKLETLKKCILILRKSYPESYALNHLDEDFVTVWWNELRHLPDEVFVKTIKRHIAKRDKFPCLADILQSESVNNHRRLLAEAKLQELPAPDPKGKERVQKLLLAISEKKSV